eukprot:3130552-Prymnesium_polylepis.2
MNKSARAGPTQWRVWLRQQRPHSLLPVVQLRTLRGTAVAGDASGRQRRHVAQAGLPRALRAVDVLVLDAVLVIGRGREVAANLPLVKGRLLDE